MIKLTKSVKAWGSSTFKEIFRNEVSQLDGRLLPLQQGMTRGSYANVDSFNVVLLDCDENAENIRANVGIVYTSVIVECACSDDPSSEDELSEYCELRFDINKQTAETSIILSG